jgi:hypothetical protein
MFAVARRLAGSFFQVVGQVAASGFQGGEEAKQQTGGH